MRIPRSWVNDFVDLSGVTDEVIADAFVRVGFEVEDVIKQGADLSGPLVVARVIAIEELAEHKKPIRYVGPRSGKEINIGAFSRLRQALVTSGTVMG